MDKDRIKGSFKKFSGRIKEAACKLLGDKKGKRKERLRRQRGRFKMPSAA
jgi:hypothetical protein